MTGNTGLLTQRCDVYGAESNIQLMGGVFPESMNGRHHWFCRNLAAGRYRMVCTGGEYGHKLANDGGRVGAYHCDGGHQGQVMPLCTDHLGEVQRRQSECCPACAYARHVPEVRTVLDRIDALQHELQQWERFGLFIEAQKVKSAIEAEAQTMTEFYERGITHRCPLILREVS